MRIFLIIIWGIMAFISVTGTLYIIINYEIQRWNCLLYTSDAADE
mgnify:CR=1 FL=1